MRDDVSTPSWQGSTRPTHATVAVWWIGARLMATPADQPHVGRNCCRRRRSH